MNMAQTTRDYRFDLIDKANEMGITLDGQRAAMAGARNTFGVVRLLSGKGGDVEFSWPAIERILNNGGRFVS
tara:strand:- start:443 stop:658 length:216 start_codon:yes stop_codon:yes gene_type:complete